MYKVNDVVYLSEEENSKLFTDKKELQLFQTVYVDKEEDVPLEKYPFKYTVGKEIEMIGENNNG